MTLEDLAKLVKRMRAVQKRYFRERSAQLLNMSKQLEKAVDAAVKEVLDDQEELF